MSVHRGEELKFSISATVAQPMEGQARLFKADEDGTLTETPKPKRSHNKKGEKTNE
jgi:hypothetical protein